MTKKLARTCLLALVALMAMAGWYSVLAADPVTLTFQYRVGDEARQQAVAAWIAEFEELNPGIKVEVHPATGEYRDTTIVSWVSGTGPDITEIWGDWAQDYARAGVLLDLRRYVDRDFTEEDINDFWPSAWAASYLHHGDNAGIQFRIPRYMITTVYYYNEEQIDAAGLLTPTELDRRGEWTYETMRDMARSLTVYSGEDISRYGFTTDSDAYRRLEVWARAFGGGFFNLEDPTQFTGADPNTVEAMTFLEQMIWQDQSTKPQFDPSSFYTGGVALVEEGNHAVLSRFEHHIAGEFRWNLAPVPVGPYGRQAYSGDDGFVIWKDTPHPDEAWEFVKFLTSKRGQEIAAIHEGLAPVRRSAMETYQQLAPHLNLDVHITNMMDASAAISSAMVGDVAQVGNILTDVLKAVMERGETSYAQAIQEQVPVIQALINQ